MATSKIKGSGLTQKQYTLVPSGTPYSGWYEAIQDISSDVALYGKPISTTVIGRYWTAAIAEISNAGELHAYHPNSGVEVFVTVTFCKEGIASV